MRAKIIEKIEKDGRTMWWCPHHKYDGRYNGLYIDHKTEYHDEWQSNKLKRERGPKKGVKQTSGPNSPAKKIL